MSAAKEARALWQPKYPELPEACASCPFRKDNEVEFGVIVGRLQKMFGVPVDMGRMAVFYARHTIEDDVRNRGDFYCHGTVYNKDMSERDPSERRQCKGASDYYRSGGRS